MLYKKKEVQESYIWVFKNGIPDSLFLELSEMKTSHQMAGSSTALGICSPITAIISGWCSSEYDIEKKGIP